MPYCKVYLCTTEVRGGPMSWKRIQSICFLYLCFSASYRKYNAVSSSREEFLLFQVTNPAKTERVKEGARRKGVAHWWWAKRIQHREVNQREPHHAHSSFYTCVEKYWVKGRKQENRNALCFENFWATATTDFECLLSGW